MTLSSVRTFDDPIEYGSNIQVTTTEMVALGRGQLSAKSTRIKLPHLWLSRFSDNLPRVARARLDPGRTFVSFPTKSNSTQMWDGRETTWGSVYQFGMRDEIVQRSLVMPTGRRFRFPSKATWLLPRQSPAKT